MLAIIRIRLFWEKERERERERREIREIEVISCLEESHWGEKFLSGRWLQFLCPMELVASRGRPPPHFSSLTFPSSSLLSRKCQPSQRSPAAPCLASLQCRPWPAATSSAPPLFDRAAVSLLLIFPYFLLGEAQLLNARMEYKQKSVTRQAEALLLKEEWNLTCISPPGTLV